MILPNPSTHCQQASKSVNRYLPGMYLVRFSFVFVVPFVFLCQRIWIATLYIAFFMSYLQYPVRRHVIPLSNSAYYICTEYVVSDHRACISWEEESARTLGVLDVDG